MNRWLAFFLVTVTILACNTAWAAPYGAATRGVYYSQKVHYITINDDNKVGHYERANIPKDHDWIGPWQGDPDDTLSLPSGYGRQDPDDNGLGEGIVVFGAQMLHFAPAFKNDEPTLFVSRYDLTAPGFITDSQGQKIATPVCPLPKNSSGNYGIAATVHGNRIYVFTNTKTLVSDDGINYTALPVLASGLAAYNPLDAITFFPPDGKPKVMVLFTIPNQNGNAAYVIWDGTSAFPLTADHVRTFSTDAYAIHGGALALGTSAGHSDFGSAGQKVPCVQVVLYDMESVRMWEYAIPYNTLAHKATRDIYAPMKRMWLFPWYVENADPQGRTVLQQYIVVNYWRCTGYACATHSWHDMAIVSDYQVPQNYDALYGWQGTPNPTTGGATPEDVAILRKYWTLVGVIAGPPPFATNEMESRLIEDASNVKYGKDATNSVEHKNTWSNSVMFSSSHEVHAGIGEKASVSDKLDVSYEHGWEGSRTDKSSVTAGIALTCGTVDESEGTWGKHGWAIFNSPILVVQTNSLYAYDYNPETGAGTYLDLDMPTIVQAQPPSEDLPALSVNGYFFSLEDPNDPNLSLNQIPGLMDGVTFPLSTDLQAWHDMKWELLGAPWKTLYGSGVGSTQVSTVSQGTQADIPFATSSRTVSTSGQTNSVKVEVGQTIEAGLKLFGFKKELAAGYEGHWSAETTNETELSQNLEIRYHFPIKAESCTASDCVEALTVQPFLLQATDSKAPWIPTGYALNKPWCITWRATFFKYADGRTAGDAPPPLSAGGTVVGVIGAGGGDGERLGSDYALKGGSMGWLRDDGTVEPIPLSGDQFDPAKGAEVRLNDYLFSADPGHGKWHRSGEVWTYQTKASATKEVFTLELDFGTGTWSFKGSHLDLGAHMPAGNSHARVQLGVNGRYFFSSDIPHAIDLVWELELSPADRTALHVTKYSGSWGDTGEEDNVVLEGTLPDQLPSFGDVSFVLNGRQIDVPLLRETDFDWALENRRGLIYDEGGRRVVVDFNKRTWSAKFTRSVLEQIMIPRRGSARLGVKVGGAEWYAQEHAVLKFKARLNFDR